MKNQHQIRSIDAAARVILLCMCFLVLGSACEAQPDANQAGVRSSLDESLPSWPTLVGGQRLVANDGGSDDGLGEAVAVSADGNTILASARDKGAYVFVRSPMGNWSQQAKLTATDSVPGDAFGASLTLSANGDVALVGAPYKSITVPGGWPSTLPKAGSVYVFRRTAAGWSPDGKLPLPVVADIQLGDAVALSAAGEVAVVSRRRVLVMATREPVGYALTYAGATWALRELTIPAAASGGQCGGLIGTGGGVAVSQVGDRLAVGLNCPKATGPSRHDAVAHYAAHGAEWRYQDAAYVSPVLAIDPPRSVVTSADGRHVLVGGGSRTFAAGRWQDRGRVVTLASSLRLDVLGQGLTSDGRVAVVSGRVTTGGSTYSPYEVFIAMHDGSAWTPGLTYPSGRYRPSGCFSGGCLFGASLAMSANGETVAVGDPARAGSVYVYSLVREHGAACKTDRECVGGSCVDGVCCESECGGGVDTDCQVCSRAKGATADGTCSVLPSGHVCRPLAGACDIAEVCDGASVQCPRFDRVLKAGTLCRPAAGFCDVAESCDGKKAACPSDDKKQQTEVCRPAAGPCDKAEYCDGGTNDCPTYDAKKDNETVCRVAKDVRCDVPESCDGVSDACPMDVTKDKTTICYRRGGTECDPHDYCDGLGSCSKPTDTELNECNCTSGGAGKCVNRSCSCK